jgi:hypothetical protein
MLPHAREQINAWSFTYQTIGFTWTKSNKSVHRTTFSEQNFAMGMHYRDEPIVAGAGIEWRIDNLRPFWADRLSIGDP